MTAVAPVTFAAVLDTNVMLDAYSVHDIMGAYDKQHTDLDAPELVWRRARARESLLALIYLNRMGWQTWGLHSELFTQLERVAPPGATAGTSFESDFTNMVIWYVRDHVLTRWEHHLPKKPGVEKGNAADQALVDKAKELGVPLITNEGFSQAGYSEGGIGKRAGKAGVKWYHPRAFYEGRIDEVKEIDNFIDRLRVEAPKYLAEHWRRHGKDESDEFLRFMIASYRHILLGQTEGRSTPVRVKLP
jgi:hypothetical protein